MMHARRDGGTSGRSQDAAADAILGLSPTVMVSRVQKGGMTFTGVCADYVSFEEECRLRPYGQDSEGRVHLGSFLVLSPFS